MIHLPVKPGTDISKLDPQFNAFAGVHITPEGQQDFSNQVTALT